jgi:anti-sigma-K factor RskA
MDDYIDNLLVLYALGDLTEEEIRQVEQYLATRPAARLRLEALKQVVSSDLSDIPAVPPAPATIDSLLARIETDTAVRRPAITPTPTNPTLLDRLRRFWQNPMITGFGFALAALIAIWALMLLQQNNTLQTERAQLLQAQRTLTAENETLSTRISSLLAENETLGNRLLQIELEKQQLDQRLVQASHEQSRLEDKVAQLTADNEAIRLAIETAESELITLREIEALLASPHTHAVTLPGTDTSPEAHGQLIANPEHHLALLVVSALPALPEEQEYQVLLIYDSGHDTADTFRVDPQGQTVLLIHSPASLNRYQAVGVSIEPKGGSPQRTGEIVLLGSLVN